MAVNNTSQPRHQPLKHSLLFVVIAVADARSPRMAPDPGGNEEETEPGCSQRRMFQRVDIGLGLTVKRKR